MTPKYFGDPDLSVEDAGDLSSLAYFALWRVARKIGVDDLAAFDEAILAKSLRVIAQSDDTGDLVEALHTIANALDHPKAVVGLKLHMPRAGRFTSTGSYFERGLRFEKIAEAIFDEWTKSKKMESAIAFAKEKFGVSRATAYEAIKHLAHQVKLSEPSFEIYTEEDWQHPYMVRYSQMRDWLYRYLDEPPADAG